jgi:hypothetical protein
VAFRDTLKDLNFGLMGYLDVRKEKLGFFFDPSFARLKAAVSTGNLDIDVTTDQSIGSRMLIDLTRDWDIVLSADVGGRGGGSDFT